jgi:phage gp16-like protein
MIAKRHTSIEPRRRAMLAKVHVAKKELGLDETLYGDVLFRETGQSSAGNCSDTELVKLLDAFKRMGWQAKPKQPRARIADHKTARKARALWISLGHLGAIESVSEQALEAFAKRQLGCDKMQWADQSLMFKLIEALKAMALREGWDSTGSDLGVVKSRLLIAILAKLKAKGYAADDWDVSEAARRIARFVSSEGHNPRFWNLGDLDNVAAAFGRLLRTGAKI